MAFAGFLPADDMLDDGRVFCYNTARIGTRRRLLNSYYWSNDVLNRQTDCTISQSQQRLSRSQNHGAHPSVWTQMRVRWAQFDRR